MTTVIEQHGMAVAAYLQGKPDARAKKAEIISDLSMSVWQFRDGIQWFRRYGGVALGYTVVCDRSTDEYVLCDEFGAPLKGDTLLGYDVHLNKGIASRSMTALAVGVTAHSRAVIINDALAVTTTKKRVRGFWSVLESFADEADRVGDTKERDRINAFLEVLVRP